MLRIKQLREEKGISQLEFAKKINLTQQSVSAYEKGIREPSLDILKTIADFFGVSTDYLLGKSDVRNQNLNISKIFKIGLTIFYYILCHKSICKNILIVFKNLIYYDFFNDTKKTTH